MLSVSPHTAGHTANHSEWLSLERGLLGDGGIGAARGLVMSNKAFFLFICLLLEFFTKPVLLL